MIVLSATHAAQRAAAALQTTQLYAGGSVRLASGVLG